MMMAFLSLTLKDSLNRWLNIIVGAIFAVLWFINVIEATQSAYWGGALLTLSAIVASALIVWYAWKHRLAS
jgi:branched-subunit amino acid transport protein